MLLSLPVSHSTFLQVLSTKVLECAKPAELQQLQAIFNRFDTDGNGTITRSELHTLIPWERSTSDFFFEVRIFRMIITCLTDGISLATVNNYRI